MSAEEKALIDKPVLKPEKELDQSPPLQAFTSFTDTELLARDFNLITWVLPNVIPEGLTVLAGKPKVGKSRFIMGLASAVARGEPFLGDMQVQQRDVLYFALEDPPRRLKDILSKIQGDTGSGRIHFSTAGPKKSESTASFLERHIEQHPNVKLIVIDTLGRFLGYKGTSSYQNSCSNLAEIKSVADKHAIAIIVIHHLRKINSDDPLDAVMGSAGITGTADTIAVLMRERGQNAGELFVTGREVEERFWGLEFDPDTISWKSNGVAAEIRMSAERQEVLQLLREENQPMKLKEIVEALKKKRPVVSKLLKGLIEANLVEQPSYGLYQAIPPDSDGSTNCGETAQTGESTNASESAGGVESARVDEYGDDEEDDDAGSENFPVEAFMNNGTGELLQKSM